MLNETFRLTIKNEITGVLHVLDDHTSENTNSLNEINSDISKVIHDIILYIILLTTIAITGFICTAACKRY